MQYRVYEIGERLTVNDPVLGTVTLEVVEDNIETCGGCFFNKTREDKWCCRDEYDLHGGSCSSAFRYDSKNIRYLRVLE